jgi:hypothetical protein
MYFWPPSFFKVFHRSLEVLIKTSHLIIDKYKSILFITTYNVGAHFKSITNLNGSFNGFDDMKND